MRSALSAWFPDPHAQTQTSTAGNTQVLSMEDQPLASRVHTPVGPGSPATGQLGESSSTTYGGRSTSQQPLLDSSPRKSNTASHGQYHSQHSHGSNSFQQQAIELNEKVQQNSSEETRLA